MKSRILLLLFFCFFVLSLSWCQSSSWSHQQSYFGYGANDGGHAIIQNRSGGLTLVGYANPPRKSGKDMLLVICDKERKDTIVHGRLQDELAYDLVQTNTGNYGIVGYSESPAKGYSGKKDGLFVLISEDGRTVRKDTLLGSPEDDEFRGIATDASGNFYLTGHKDGAFWVVKIDTQGQVQWQKTWRSEHFSTGQAITVLADGKIAAVGYSELKRFQYRLNYQLLSEAGEVLERTYFEGDRGLDLLQATDGNLVITGIAPEERENMLLLKIQPDGELLWRKHHQGNYKYDNADAGHAIVLDNEGNICVAGVNSSSLRGMSRNVAWVSILDQEGNIIRDTLLGGNSEDNAQDICLTYDGALAMTGFSASGKGLFQDAWLVRFAAPEMVTNWDALEVSNITFWEESNDGVLKANELGHFSIEIHNTANQPSQSENWKVQVSNIDGINIPENIVLPSIPAGGTSMVFLPLEGLPDLPTTRLVIRLYPQESGLRIPPQTIVTSKATFANLTLLPQDDETFLSQGGGKPARGELVQMQIKLANQGDAPAKDVEIQFILPKQVEALAAEIQNIPSLAIGEEHAFTLSLATDQLYLQDTVEIKVLVRHSGLEKTVSGRYKLALKPFKSATKEPEPTVVTTQDYTKLYWSSPLPDDVIRGLIPRQDSLFSIRLVATSSQPLAENHFTVLQNGEPLNKGKFRNVSLLPSDRNRDGIGQEFSYTFSMENILLLPGENIFEVNVDNKGGHYTADLLRVDYSPPKPNLHILAIGVPQIDLQFTSKDARDFANALAAQEGQLFGRVYTRILDTEALTTALELRKALRNLVYDFEGNRIREQDVVAVFISSHGKLFGRQENVFRFFASDYDNLYPEETTVDYERHLVDVLAQVNCTKLAFIDACYSGGIGTVDAIPGNKGSIDARRDLSGALNQLLAAQAGLRALASCQAEERSYEDPAWQNGAFTEAILEAFVNEEVKGVNGMLQANTNDAILTMAELHRFLAERVPYLAKKQKGAKALQTPYLVEKYREEELPLFFYGE